jgi:site-specific recombinase XerD
MCVHMSFYLKRGNIIYFNFWLFGLRHTYSTKIKIDREEWDLKIQRPKARRGTVGEANRKITNELNEYQKKFDELKQYYKESLTKQVVKKEFDEYFQLAQVSKTLSYSDYFNIYIEQKKESQSVQKDSWQKYTRIHTAIMNLQKKNKTTYYLSSFDSAFFMEFIGYLRSEKDISDNTLRRKLGFFKSFLNWCVRNGYSVNSIFKEINIKPRETYHVALSEKDLKVLENLELNEVKSYYRDLFLIGVYSGQRVSDYSRFNKEYIEGDSIVIRAKKTGQFSYIPLNPKLKKLLDKYDWKLSTISGQKFNVHIHEICKIAGFNEIVIRERFYGNKKKTERIPRFKLIASHTARRTFITLSEQKGVSHSQIMKVTGIRSLKTLQGYIKVNSESLSEAIIKAWT